MPCGAMLRVLAGTMFNVVFGTMLYALLVHSHGAMAVKATNVMRRPDHLRNFSLGPLPNALAIHHERLLLLASRHQVMRKETSLPVETGDESRFDVRAAADALVPIGRAPPPTSKLGAPE